MKLVDKIGTMQGLAGNARLSDQKIGLVPTMGYLHQGHLSLVRLARAEADILVVSIFVNPKQFGEGEDYESYPRNMESDVDLLEKEYVDVLFTPDLEEMYPEGFSTYVEVQGLTDTLCGKSRPGHFKGVTTVVTKLFNAVRPHFAVFGEKDYQQAVVIKRMTHDLNMDIDIVLGPTVREEDGLAMSSRNTYLTEDERRDAQIICQSLLEAKRMVAAGATDAAEVTNAVRRMIEEKETTAVEYVKAIHPETLAEMERIEEEAVIAVAVKFGRARLIDNMRVGERS